MCDQWMDKIEAWIDGEGSEENAELVRLHIEECEACRHYVDAVLAIRASFPQIEDTMVPLDFAQGVMARIAEQTPQTHKKTSVRWKQWALPAVACLALLVSAKGLFPQPVPSGPTVRIPTTIIEPETIPSSEPEVKSIEPEPEVMTAEVEAGVPNNNANEHGMVGEQPIQEPVLDVPQVTRVGNTEYAETITLSKDEVGEWLDEYTPIELEDGSQSYIMSMDEFDALLQDLEVEYTMGASDSSTELMCQVVVTQG